MEHGVAVYHQGLRLLLVIKFPHQRAPRVVEKMVSQIDIVPTILEAAGIPIPSSFAGRSLFREVPPDRLL